MSCGRWFTFPGLVLLAAACARGPSETVRPIDAPVRVQVTNNHALAVKVFVVGSGTTHRLGTVHPGMVAEFTVPPGMVSGNSVEFGASSPAGDSYRSGEILLAPGAIVDVVVATRMFNSTVTLRP